MEVRADQGFSPQVFPSFLFRGYDGEPNGPSGHEIAVPNDPAGGWDRIIERRWNMFVPVMWIIWSVLVVFLAAVYIYRSSLSKNEEDQIFLDDSFDQEKAEQSVIATKIEKVEPLIRAGRWMVIAMTIVVIVYYAWDILVQLNIL